MPIDDSKIIPPVGHPLRAGYNPETARPATAGDRHPSDLDDVFPFPVCRIATGAELAPQLEPDIIAFEPLAEQNFINDLGKADAGGLNGGSSDDKESHGCGEPSQSLQGCEYEVKVTYITPILIAPYRSDINGFGGPCTGQQGRPCTGPHHTMCHVFGSLFSATAFASQKRAEANALWENGGYSVGKSDVLNVGPVKGIAGEGYAGGCDEGSGGSGGGAGDAGGEEIKQPACDSPVDCGCPPSSKRNAQGICEPIPGEYEEGKPCPPGHKRDPRTRLCVPDSSNCPPGTHLNQFGVCVAN
jgi:hypothetical protein